MSESSGRSTLDFTKMRTIPENDAEKRALEICKPTSVPFEARKTVFLIDLFGIYHRVMEWMAHNDVPVSDAELPSSIAGHLLTDAMLKVRKHELEEFGAPGMDFDDLVRKLCVYFEGEAEPAPSRVNRIEIRWEFFFAPSPVGRITEKLKSWGKKTPNRERLLRQVSLGKVPTGFEVRDYSIYDSFIQELRNWLDAKLADPGFYGIHVNENVISLSEKEVDIRIAIRAMDIMAGNEADAICIVSSDQDYGPLHERIQDAGLRCYFADVAKFARRDNVGRKIRHLENTVTVGLSDKFFWRIIEEHVGSPQMLRLTNDQYSALYRIYREHGGSN